MYLANDRHFPYTQYY